MAIVPSTGEWAALVFLAAAQFLMVLDQAVINVAISQPVAGSYQSRDRALAYGVLGGVAGAGIAVGPILGGGRRAN